MDGEISVGLDRGAAENAVGPGTVARALSAGQQVIYEWLADGERYRVTGALEAVLGRTVTAETFLDARRDNRLAGGRGPANTRQQFHLSYRTTDQASADDLWLEEWGERVFGADGRLERVVGLVRRCNGTVVAQSAPEEIQRLDPTAGGAPQTLLTGQAMAERLRLVLRETDRAPAYVVVGIDGIADVNMAHGYEIGDEIITALSMLVLKQSRSGDVAARLSATKIALLLDAVDADGARESAMRLLHHVREMPIVTSRGVVRATVSIGVVCADAMRGCANDIMILGEGALADARKRGGDTLVVRDTAKDGASEHNRASLIADQIVAGLNENRFVLAYQPIVTCDEGIVDQWECLVRLIGEDGQPIPAGHFIPVAEDFGLIRRIDLHVLRLALADLKAHGDLRLSVNISGSGTVERAWLDTYVETIRAEGDVARRLTVEITEYAQIDDVERSAGFVTRLRELGCTLAIDDFGAGYTSFRNLQRLDVDIVKIDGAFVRNLAEHHSNRVFTRSLIDLARQIGLRTVAECVESDADVAVLRSMGADYLQGFHLGRPILDPPWRTTPVTAQTAAAS